MEKRKKNKMLSTIPKPFIFVLMPFDDNFNDIYKYGIKGAAEDAGAYAERVDEQIFIEGILERIFNQISKADVIVADMTDRNPNVFYEVGYAHALGKIVLLLTQKADDIPFDLKNRPHTVYAGKIEILRKDLTRRLIWAIDESKKQRRQISAERFLVSISGTEIPEARFSRDTPYLISEKDLSVSIRNDSLETTPLIEHIYLLTSDDSSIRVDGIHDDVYSRLPDSFDSSDDLVKQIPLNVVIPSLPPKAFAMIRIRFRNFIIDEDELVKLRIHSSSNLYDFPFYIKLQ